MDIFQADDPPFSSLQVDDGRGNGQIHRKILNGQVCHLLFFSQCFQHLSGKLFMFSQQGTGGLVHPLCTSLMIRHDDSRVYFVQQVLVILKFHFLIQHAVADSFQHFRQIIGQFLHSPVTERRGGCLAEIVPFHAFHDTLYHGSLPHLNAIEAEAGTHRQQNGGNAAEPHFVKEGQQGTCRQQNNTGDVRCQAEKVAFHNPSFSSFR